MSKVASITKTVGAASVALLTLSGAALAEEFSWSVNAAGTSDYVFRGVSQTNEDPAFQAGIDIGYGIFYAGAWGSNVDSDFVGGSSAEIDFYAGIKPTLGPATFDFGVIYYWYPGSSDTAFGLPGAEPDVVELKAGVSGEILPNLTAGAVLYWSPDATYETGEYFVYEGALAYALPTIGIFSPSISGTYGEVENQDDSTLDYAYWNAGLSLGVEKFTFDFRYWDTDVDNSGIADERFVFTAKVALP